MTEPLYYDVELRYIKHYFELIKNKIHLEIARKESNYKFKRNKT